MAKLTECLKGALPADFVQCSIWNMIGSPVMVGKKHGQSTPRRETTSSIFADCKEQRMRKRVRENCTPSTGSIVCAVRVGTYTTCVCKHKM